MQKAPKKKSRRGFSAKKGSAISQNQAIVTEFKTIFNSTALLLAKGKPAVADFRFIKYADGRSTKVANVFLRYLVAYYGFSQSFLNQHLTILVCQDSRHLELNSFDLSAYKEVAWQKMNELSPLIVDEHNIKPAIRVLLQFFQQDENEKNLATTYHFSYLKYWGLSRVSHYVDEFRRFAYPEGLIIINQLETLNYIEINQTKQSFEFTDRLYLKLWESNNENCSAFTDKLFDELFAVKTPLKFFNDEVLKVA